MNFLQKSPPIIFYLVTPRIFSGQILENMISKGFKGLFRFSIKAYSSQIILNLYQISTASFFSQIGKMLWTYHEGRFYRCLGQLIVAYFIYNYN